MPMIVVSPEDELIAWVASVPEGHVLKRFVKKLAEYLDEGTEKIRKQYCLCNSFEEHQKLAGEEEGHIKTKMFLEGLLIRPKEGGDNEGDEE